ncbi:peptidase M48 Ste24p [Thioalkalivibrio denitrificans]|uniref:Peptidase M48 Ste24p n=1 Tax=Thioalkalivibrio denitrificans TaxID=108003 RepID=A0A1V3NDT0_9GAMM|nr:M48 family metalloprotease [Thioalkalivibrio denitrificans]OOG23134.1 peptidase M48 Ste24p [Thioalkalivibrio denitrificans]
MDRNPGLRIFQRRMTRRDFLWLTAAATSATVVTSPLLGCATDPITGQRRLILMSEQEEIAIDRRYAPHQFSNDYGLVRDDELQRYVSEVGTGIAEISHRPHMPYDFNVVNANHINAYTFPAGTMACTRGIMVEMEDEAALAALLGHETGHVNARHTARRQTRGIFAAMVVGGLGIAAAQSDRLAGHRDLIYAISAVGATALLAHYSRENEREADSLGLTYMAQAGHNPQGMVDLMDMLRGLSDRQPNAMETMFATHPMSDERFATARRESHERHADALDRNVRRERYMDNTAALRRIRPAIKELQAGEAAMARRDYPGAETRFRSALEQVPDDYPALVLMARCQSAQGRHREAESYLARAREAYPAEGQAIHLSGINQLALNRPEEALAHFRQYERHLPGNLNTLFLQGVAHENMQNRAAAAELYRRYLREAGDTEQARYAAGRLQSWQML